MKWLCQTNNSGGRIIRMAIGIGVISLLSFSGVAFAASPGHGPVEPKEWLNTDWYRVMNFAVLAVGLFFLVRKPVSQAMGSRIKSIKDQLVELETQKQNAEKTLAQFNEKISLLESEASKIIAQYEEQGRAARQRILQEAAVAAQKLEEQARKNIEHEFNVAKTNLQEEIIGKALAKAGELLHTSITSDDQERLVDDYITKVVAQ